MSGGINLQQQQAQINAAHADNSKGAGGKSTGTRGWKPDEGKALLEECDMLCLDESVGEGDKRWTTLADNLAKRDPSWANARKPSALRDHVKEMVTLVRSMSSSYSIFAAKPENESLYAQCPDAKDWPNAEVLFDNDEWTQYTLGLATYYDVLKKDVEVKKKLDIKTSWWDADVLAATREFIWRNDTAKG